MRWKVIETCPSPPQEIMQKDRDLLHAMAGETSPILHLYDWNPASITYGYFLDPKKFFSQEGLDAHGVAIARRPTGGGIIFHLWDLAFSALVPASHPKFSQNTLENYAYINEAVLQAVQAFLQMKTGLGLTPVDGDLLTPHSQYFCMAKPTKYDVMFAGRKVAGAAQRKTKEGLLHQGSISLLMPDPKIVEAVLLSGPEVLPSMNIFTYPLLQQAAGCAELAWARSKLKDLLKEYLTKK